MKKIAFLLLALFLLGFDYGYSKKNDFEEAIRNCKETCGERKSSEFCKRICEFEIFALRWKFLGFDTYGSAWFYDSKSMEIYSFSNEVEVWVKIIPLEENKWLLIEDWGSSRKIDKFDYILNLFEINCSIRRYEVLEVVVYAKEGSIMENVSLGVFGKRIKFPGFLSRIGPIPPESIVEVLFEEVCKYRKR